jgi:CRISPR/Cas system-associated exonuclease Cas4 (RecB family)
MAELSKADLDSIKTGLRVKGRLIPIVSAQAAVENNQHTKKRDTKYLHPSEICKRDWCPRSSMYKILGEVETKEKQHGFTTLNIFATGHLIHNKWQGWLERSGLVKQSELPIFNEEYHIMGTADGLIEDANGQAILEIKSVGTGTVRYENMDLYKQYESKEITDSELFKRIRQPFITHLRQLNIYMHVTGIHHGIILYEWKATQECKEFEVRYQPALIQHILAAASLVKQHLQNGTLIDRPEWAEKNHKTCKQCPYKDICWSDDVYQHDTTNEPSNAELSRKVQPS